MKLGKIEKRYMISQKHAKSGIEHVERLLPYVSPKENQNYLEIGCGNGHVCKYLTQKYHLNVTGTDVDPEMIQFAKENVGDILHISFLEIDATKMPFEDNKFDIVLSFGVLHHERRWKKALEEISRVMKPQGFFIFGDLAYSKFITRVFGHIVKKYGFYTINEITNYSRKNNLKIIHKDEPTGTVMKYHNIVFQKKL